MLRSILLFSLILLMSGGATAGIIKVPDQYSTIQAGINAAFQGDTVLVAAGTYYENIDFKGKAITVASHFLIDGDTTHVNSTIIDGSKPSDPNKGSVVSFVSGEDTTSALCGFTITGGSGTYYAPYSAQAGGGIYCLNSGCKAVANKIVNNSITGPSAFGGGLAAIPAGSNAWVVLKYNQIAHNTATANTNYARGGGVILYCHARIDGNSISYNTCTTNTTGNYLVNGGGICCLSASSYQPLEIFMENNMVTHNSIRIIGNPGQGPVAYGGGGFIQYCNGRMTGNEISFNEVWDYSNWGAVAMGISVGHSPDSFIIEGNIIRGNTYKHGTGDSYIGGLHIFGTDAISVVNNLIEGNSATYGGGVGINHYINPCTVVMVNNTIINNIATYGGALRIYQATAYIMNTIIWGNQAPTNAGIYIDESGTVKAAYCEIQGGWAGTGNIKSDPQFITGSAELSETSPCLGAGIASFNFGNLTLQAPTTDILGNIRPSPSVSRPDIGAFEHERGFAKRPHFVEVPNDYPTIQAGINAAFPGDTVLVAYGTYYENIDFKGKAITVASHFLIDGDTTHVNSTIIDGSKPSDPNKGSVVSFVSGEDTTSVLCGFTITGGTGTVTINSRAGGGILCYNAGARILNNKIIGNTVTSLDKMVFGGGIVALPSGSTAYVIIQDNQIIQNALTANAGVVAGGGVGLYFNGKLINNQISYNSVVQNSLDQYAFSGGVDCDCQNAILDSNKITHNSLTSYSNVAGSTFAGGATIFGCQGRLSKNHISNNTVWVNTDKGGHGAGFQIMQTADSFIIEGNFISENAVIHGRGWGGGANITRCSPLVINNIFVGNSATNGGGLFLVGNNMSHLINNTIVNNQATEGGGMVISNSSAPILMNNIIWGNTASSNPAITLWNSSVKTAYCDIQGGWSGTGNINADPLFADTLFQLSDGSPCIDTGIASFDFGGGMMCLCPATDIAGNSRPNQVGSNPDMGAYELLTTEVINSYQTEIPQSYFLAQNYPNPFNSSTTIEFALPKPAFVTLKVYNLLGEEVATLVSEKQSAGIHKFTWDARGLASGVYLYRLEAGEFVQTKKLILMR